jgi:hypothetical protein
MLLGGLLAVGSRAGALSWQLLVLLWQALLAFGLSGFVAPPSDGPRSGGLWMAMPGGLWLLDRLRFLPFGDSWTLVVIAAGGVLVASAIGWLPARMAGGRKRP